MSYKGPPPEDFQYLHDQIAISSTIVETAIQEWWWSEGNPKLVEQMNNLRLTTGKCIRLDHTYKIASNLGMQHFNADAKKEIGLPLELHYC